MDWVLFIFAALKLPMPFAIWFHIHIQNKRLKLGETINRNAPVLLPIYHKVVYVYIIYIIARFFDLLLGLSSHGIGFSQVVGEPPHAETVPMASLYFVMGEGIVALLIFVLFAFLTSPSAGRYALRKASADASKLLSIYAFIYIVTLTSDVDRQSKFLLKLFELGLIVLFLSFKLIKMMWVQSPRWTCTTYFTLALLLLVYSSYLVMCTHSMLAPLTASDQQYQAYALISLMMYDFIFPILFYKVLIDDSRYWRNFEKELSKMRDLETFKIFE